MTDPKHWAVSVSVDGDNVLTIESNCLAGVENIDAHRDTIRSCAEHLLAFIGDPVYAAFELDRLRATNAALEKERDEAVNWTDIVDRHGTDQFDDLAEAWLAMEPIQRVHNAVASVFSKWANDELMTRFKSHMASTLQIAFVEGCLVGVRAAEAKARAALTPTPAPQERQNG